ncbi:hypothetical protein MMC13_006245 [Lambiella insularis]|nr:hypothetical protein [Lambiella insularis]
MERLTPYNGRADFWRTVAIPSKKIPSLKTTDGPNGARGSFFKDGTPAALFPCGVSLAATWNKALVREVGEHISEETKARGADILLAPTICIHRSPLGGRNFESFSEDPYLTGKLAAAYVNGLQSRGIAATPKHFVGNEQETLRMQIDSNIQERPLREIYLKPFEIVVRESSPWALMSSYNRVNGIHADMNRHTLSDILRGEWQYDGLVMSDWTGVNSVAESIAAGCDLEMPGPSKWRGERAIKAVESGELLRTHVERSASKVIRLIERTKGLKGPKESSERADDRPETRDLIRRAGQDGLTLLKNKGILPLADGITSIALIGPNAKRAVAGGGGSASLKPYYTTSPYDGLKSTSKSKITYARGCYTNKWLPLMSDLEDDCRTPSGRPGVVLEYYKGDRLEGRSLHVQHKTTTELFLWDSAPKDVLPEYSFRTKCSIFPKSTGMHTISISSVGPAKLFVNQELFIDNWDWTEHGEAMFENSVEASKDVQLQAGSRVDITVESSNEKRPRSMISPDKPTHGFGGCRIGYQEEEKHDLLQEAVDIAKQADVAVVCVGLDAEWESEGYDRQTMDLPRDGNQDELIRAIVKANPRTIVVNQSGTPVTMPWAAEVPAILQAWYQGQEAGRALADVLLGRVSPGGKLPVTFPQRLQDNPSFHNWPGENLTVVYGEGLFVGYKHYDAARIAPLFPFGHGLSYTTFHYGAAELSASTLAEADTLVVSLPVTNTGRVAGSEIVQAYVRDPQSRLPRPEKELQAFEKVYLSPGETATVRLELDKYSVGYYDTSLHAWIAEEGVFEVLIAASSADVR